MKKGKEEAIDLLNELNITFDEKNFIDKVRENNLEIVELFLQAGMPPDTIFYNGAVESFFKPAPLIAVEKGYIQMLRLLLKNDDRFLIDSFMYAAMIGQQNVVEELFEEATQNDVHQLLKVEVLRYSVGGGHLELVKTLVEKGIDINKANFKTGITALMCASSSGNTEIVKYLLERGADPNLLDVRLQTALMFASSNGYLDIVKILIKAGAELEIKDEEDKTALMFAQEEGHYKVIKFIERIKGA